MKWNARVYRCGMNEKNPKSRVQSTFAFFLRSPPLLLLWNVSLDRWLTLNSSAFFLRVPASSRRLITFPFSWPFGGWSYPTQPNREKKKKPTTWYNNNNNHLRFTLKAITLHKNYTVQTEGNVSLASIHFDSLLRNVISVHKTQRATGKENEWLLSFVTWACGNNV